MKNHSMNIRVYYEDTDLGGVVYYANYLRFIERARSEWIRNLGIDQIKMRNEEKAIFVVTKLKADYLRPAHFDDILKVETKIKVVSPVRAYFYQNIFREEEVIFNAEVCVTCTSTSGKGRTITRKD
jgi:acyl-CoA thioester hydrolase